MSLPFSCMLRTISIPLMKNAYLCHELLEILNLEIVLFFFLMYIFKCVGELTNLFYFEINSYPELIQLVSNASSYM